MRERKRVNVQHHKKKACNRNKPIVPFSTSIWANPQMHQKSSFLHCLHKPYQVKPAFKVVLPEVEKKSINKNNNILRKTTAILSIKKPNKLGNQPL